MVVVCDFDFQSVADVVAELILMLKIFLVKGQIIQNVLMEAFMWHMSARVTASL